MEEYLIGDYVGFQHNVHGYREGVVIGSRTEYPSGRKIIEVEVDAGYVYQAWYPTVTRIRRVQYSLPPPTKRTFVERKIYW